MSATNWKPIEFKDIKKGDLIRATVVQKGAIVRTEGKAYSYFDHPIPTWTTDKGGQVACLPASNPILLFLGREQLPKKQYAVVKDIMWKGKLFPSGHKAFRGWVLSDNILHKSLWIDDFEIESFGEIIFEGVDEDE